MRQRVRRFTDCRGSLRRRSGAATIWLILIAPVMMIMVVAVIDLSNQTAARNELEHALESAALAAVETWGKNQPNSAPSRSAARIAGVNFALANNVRGQPLVITSNGGGPPTNENASCSGNLVLGGMTNSGSLVTFNAGSDPGCGRSSSTTVEFGVDITVTTDPAGSTFNDANAFQFKYNSANPAGYNISQIVINLRGNGDTDASWHLNTTGVPAVPTEATGYGPVNGTLTGITSSNISYVPGGSPVSTPSVLTINFLNGDFSVGDEFHFGADTDLMGVCMAALQDRGGAFGNGNAPGMCTEVGAQFTITFSNGTNTVTITSFNPLTRLGPNSSSKIGQTGSQTVVVVIPDVDFAVKAQGSVTIPSMWNSLFGVAIGPSHVSATSFARFPCTTGPAKIERADTVICP